MSAMVGLTTDVPATHSAVCAECGWESEHFTSNIPAYAICRAHNADTHDWEELWPPT